MVELLIKECGVVGWKEKGCKLIKSDGSKYLKRSFFKNPLYGIVSFLLDHGPAIANNPKKSKRIITFNLPTKKSKNQRIMILRVYDTEKIVLDDTDKDLMPLPPYLIGKSISGVENGKERTSKAPLTIEDPILATINHLTTMEYELEQKKVLKIIFE